MKLKHFIFAAIASCLMLGSCNDKDSNTTLLESYSEWKEKNDKWLKEQIARTDQDGKPYFSQIVPKWNPKAFVLIHYINDRKLTEGNLTPLYTSTVDTRYYLEYCNGTAVDSSYNLATYGPGIFRTQLGEVITGWAIALMDMRVGDSAEVIIPYEQGYGVSTSSGVAPYSNLKFNMSLVDIPYYEVNPK